MKKFKFLYLFLLIYFCASCTKDRWFEHSGNIEGNSSPYNLISPQIRVAVVSDIHYMDPLIAPDDPENNPVWQDYVSHDRKIFELSDYNFRNVISDLKNERPDVLLVAGDMAKDGELVCHETVKGLFQQLENEGIQVFVVPGNNDINNPDAKDWTTDPPSNIASISEEEFTEIYGDFGYDEALYRDAASLSYICQPSDGLWILGIDGIRRSASGTSGAINPLTLVWIQEKMTEANEKNITVLPVMHFGILEHYSGQKNLEPLIKSSRDNAVALMNAGIRVIFTGHYHANDIVEFKNEGMTFYDVQTGSLVTPPYSYRIMTLDDNFINIDTRRVTYDGSLIPGNIDFEEYSGDIFTGRINGFFTFYGSGVRYVYGIPADQYPAAVPFFTEAFKAYLAGDEKLNTEEREEIEILGQSVPSALPVLNTLWTDLKPKDNKTHIKLK